MKRLAYLALLTLSLTVTAALADGAKVAVTDGVIDVHSADQVLQPGDVLLKFLGETTKISTTEKLITGGQKIVKTLSGIFHQELKKADAKAFHMAVYLGKGRTAEAHGGDLKTARVAVRSLDDHAGYLFKVYRPHDRALAAAAAHTAELWANGRMHYLVPIATPIQRANFGPEGKAEALEYGRAANTAGGPPKVKAMFCSEFVMAVYQAASVARELQKNPKLAAKDVTVDLGVELQASHGSPLAADSRLENAVSKKQWDDRGEYLVRPAYDANGASANVTPGPDVTAKLKRLGNPNEKRYPSGEWVYARNPWTLRALDGKIYVGAGNSNNPHPAPNAGPVDLWAFDTKSNAFKIEYTVGDEQVDQQRVIDGELWIPGHDSHLPGMKANPVNLVKDWALGNMHHKRKSGVWEKLRTIKNGIHVYDVLEFDHKLFAAISTLLGGSVARSEDQGLTWHEMTTYLKPAERTRSLFVFNNHLYASTSGGRLYEYDGKKNMHELSVPLFPGLADPKVMHAAKPTSFGTRIVYIGAKKLIDHDWTPLGLFELSSPQKTTAAPLPFGALPRDLLVENGTLYVLASTQPTPTQAMAHVFVTKDLKTWTEELRFTEATFARSFERLNGDYYFGLGCEPDRLIEATGRIYRLPH